MHKITSPYRKNPLANLPTDLGAVAWEKKSWKLFGINTSYHFLMLLVASLIVTYM